ncbi:alkylhydroperoxidase family enzyme [Aurantimicrobium minutum]|uniref:carboxymuconolactone decarboxylase family protein n=1 Tax=Aurantimicrobium minutum TaxID=708131 RepID=UPI002473D8DB|nr:carboxymuconolactone decarboxylase family protein [Aurantimicrobium minutum]MDH6207103.1 alkylhydroperoxidase family enzyme [Aurantimicrobium minutum]MDH6424285.1 alkylhydroperoxidase family enzyme [Aurantimicrobium minutum]
MALIKLVDPDTLEGTPREVAESGIAQYGKALNTWQAIMNKPDLFAAYLPFLRQVAGPGALDGELKDLSALYVGYLNNCRYTASHRFTSARAKGVSDDQMRAVVHEEWSGLSDKYQVALKFTKAITLLPTLLPHSEEPQIADEKLLAELKTHFSDQEILELTMSISVWNALARFHRVMGFELDMPEAPEGVNPL